MKMGKKKEEHHKEEHQKEEQQKEEKQKEGQQQQMGVDPKKKYGNPTRRIFYDADGICTCGEEADNVYVVKPGEHFVEKDEVLICANSSRITFGDYVYLSNYGLPKNVAQKEYMICMIRTFGSDFFNNDLTSKTGTGFKLGVAHFLAQYAGFDKFKPYLYPGDKEIYQKQNIDVAKFRGSVVTFIKALLKKHSRGENDYETLDNLIGPIERDDDNLKKQYEEIVKTAISIRKAKFEHEEKTGEAYYIK
ncbi:uncharacterized protein LOC111050398 [Nilaparvata lugens]|uniref:uncharacterized protein LOC111050398 n=1 Tax=Nilaparvata lugens TaxID=108931 RepID=UPI00193C9970|nr:uncharacterized protein LOC111050398 [Nilaparvata lugens]